jgi:predicted lysophospholipase L1 biosynthesis ABC-type transport system permease subunit
MSTVFLAAGILADEILGFLELWSTLAQLASTFQKTLSLSHLPLRQAWKTRPIRVQRVPKKVEFAPWLA